MDLPALFHWSPSANRLDIQNNGLQLYSPSLCQVWDPATGEDVQVRWPYICLGTDPRLAWSLSGDMDWASEIEEWDLWLVELRARDDIQIRSDLGPSVKEVRSFNTLPPDRLWWVGQRTPPVAITEQPKPKRARVRKG